MGTPIIIRHNQDLKDLAKLLDMKSNDISDRIINHLCEVDKYFCKAHCGLPVKEVRENETPDSVGTFATRLFGKSSDEICRLLDRLEFMDAANDCPQCGCELRHDEQYGYCTNCGYDEEPDPDMQFGGPDYN